MSNLNIKNNLQSQQTPNTLSVCKDFIDNNLYELLLNETRWLDIEALKEINYFFLKSKDREKYTINLLHRLSKVTTKIEIETIRYDYKQFKSLTSKVRSFIDKKIEHNNKKGITNFPNEILESLYSESFRYYLPKISLPSVSQSVQLNKLLCQRWWWKQLKNTIRQESELLKIAIGAVGENNQQYSSNKAVNDYELSLKANAFVPIQQHTHTAFLTDLKPADQRRFYEYLAISKGIEKRAKSKGLMSSLLTLTLPPEYHANPKNGNSEGWKGYSPAESYKKLRSIANKFNKVLHKAGIYKNGNFYSIKAIEPHSDGTPHLHILLFFLHSDKNKIQESIAFQFEDALFNESSKAYNWVDIDEGKSSPINYLSKHFVYSKNNTLSNNIRAASTKALWKMKSFSFTGLPRGAKTLWKECRKIGFRSNTYQNELEENLVDFACSGNFENFLITLEKATAEDSIKIIYTSVESKYSENNSSFSHIEYNISNTNPLDISIDIRPTNYTKVNLSKNTLPSLSSNIFKKRISSYFIAAVKLVTNISNNMSNRIFSYSPTLTADKIDLKKIKTRNVFHKFKLSKKI